MAKFVVCPYCGASLDFGEKCDCNEKGTPKSANEKRDMIVCEFYHNEKDLSRKDKEI